MTGGARGGAPGSGAPVVLAHLSDLHFGAHDDASVESLLRDVEAAAPSLTVVTGDLTQRGRPREFAAAVAFLRRLPSPRLVVLGNHDVPLDPLHRFTGPYDRYLAHVARDLDPVVDADGVRALGLGSMPRWRWKSGHVSQRQADRLAQVMDAAPQGAVRVVALHHPVSAAGTAAIAGRDRLLTALARSRVELVLAGHTHRPSLTWLELDEGGSWCVLEGVAGSATSTRLRGVPRSWSVYRIDPTTISAEERRECRSAGSGPSTGSTWSTADLRLLRRRSVADVAGTQS